MVKKCFAILLLAALLFNLFGHRVLMSFLEDQANLQLEEKLDGEDYDPGQLVSIKIPVSYLPYYNNSSSFERVNGEVDIAGTHYKYVKRRILNDSLELLCIPNMAAMGLKEASNEFFRFVNDLQHSGQTKSQGSAHRSFSTFSSDYLVMTPFFGLQHLPDLEREFSRAHIVCAKFPYHTSLERPPQSA